MKKLCIPYPLKERDLANVRWEGFSGTGTGWVGGGKDWVGGGKDWVEPGQEGLDGWEVGGRLEEPSEREAKGLGEKDARKDRVKG